MSIVSHVAKTIHVAAAEYDRRVRFYRRPSLNFACNRCVFSRINSARYESSPKKISRREKERGGGRESFVRGNTRNASCRRPPEVPTALIFYGKAGADHGGNDTRMAPIISLHMGTAIDRDTMGRTRRGINHREDRARYISARVCRNRRGPFNDSTYPVYSVKPDPIPPGLPPLLPIVFFRYFQPLRVHLARESSHQRGRRAVAVTHFLSSTGELYDAVIESSCIFSRCPVLRGPVCRRRGSHGDSVELRLVRHWRLRACFRRATHSGACVKLDNARTDDKRVTGRGAL